MSLPTYDEKGPEASERLASATPSTTDNNNNNSNRGSKMRDGGVNDPETDDRDSTKSTEVDAAWRFINDNRDAPGVDDVNLKSLRRRIDWHIVPLMFGCYTMQFLDKVIYNYAAAMGIIPDLGLFGNRFSNVATFLFVALLVFEIPNVYLLQRVPAAKWLGLNVALWGVATACGAAAHDYPTMLASRVFVGIFEATIAPSLAIISSQWYTKSEQAPRFSFWYLGLGFGQIVGGVVSWGFQHVAPDDGGAGAGAHHQLAGWRVMFVTLGCLTVVIGLAVVLLVPDTPMRARWMSVAEKVALLRHVSVNQTGLRSTAFRWAEVVDALADPQVWLQVLPVALISVSSGVVTTFSVRLVGSITRDPRRTAAQNSRRAALMNTPSGAVSIFFTLLVGFGVRRQSHRWLWILACIIPAIIGGALMSFVSDKHPAGQLAGIYLVNAVVAPMPMQYGWMMANVAGATKRAFAVALISAAFSVGNIIGPQTFRAEDAPDFRPAKLALLFTQTASAVVTVLLFLYYVWANRRRAGRARQTEDQYADKEAWRRQTDRENPTFRYEY